MRRPTARRPLALVTVGGFALAMTAIQLVPGSAAHAATVPSGFTDAAIAGFSSPTAVESLPDSRVVVLEQGGQVRIGDADGPFTTALSLPVCTGGERGLLGFTTDAAFLTNGNVYVYYTRTAPGAPGGCVNRVSRFTMSNSTINPASEVVLIDNISSVAGNHNGGDLDVGSDGYLYISVGDAGSDPRGRSGANPAAQDLSLLNGKILRITVDGLPAPGNPISGGDSVRCATRGNTPSTPTTPCQELFAWGLRNPYRFAFDRNDGSNRFFINDVGQSTREEVDLGTNGANYGWPEREGFCPRGDNPPCTTNPSFVDPITDYGRGDGQFVTAGAFVPSGLWPNQFDGAYLFGDGGSGSIFMRTAAGTVDYSTPFATGAGGIADMTFGFNNAGLMVLFYVQNGGGLRSITPSTAPATSARNDLRMIPVTPVRAYDTGNAATPAIGVAKGDVFNGSTRLVDLNPPAAYEAALVNITYADSRGVGFVRTWGTRAVRPETSSLNSDSAASFAPNATIVPLDADGTFVLESTVTARMIVDVMAWFDDTGGAVTSGRFAALTPARLIDTRSAGGATLESGSTNPYTQPAGNEIEFAASGQLGVPNDGTASAVVLSIGAIAAGGPGGFVGAFPTGSTWAETSNVNVVAGDTRANMMVVPLGTGGHVSLRTLNVADVVVDVLGYVTSGSAPSSTSGLYSSIDSTRIVDTRLDLGFANLDSAVKSVTVPGSSPVSAVVQNVTVTAPLAAGYVSTFPQAGSPPVVSTINFSAANQTRAALAFTALPPSRGVSYVALVPTELVVDVVGTFSA
jgi:glucose/arabinose dehydrogenase